MQSIPILFDTDIGGDIDDALALAYLLRQPQCELVGITTATGEPERRAMLADAICRAEGRTDIPIHAGCPEPFLVEQRQTVAHQAEVLPRWEHRSDFQGGTAVPFLRDTIRSRPGELTLLAVGPMTNLGLLFTLDPEIARLLRRLVLMCGVFTRGTPGVPTAEWNALVDPHATAMVYRAAVADHLSIGLDVTCRCTLDASDCMERLRAAGLNVVADMAGVWARGGERVTFHDPLAAAVIFAPDLVTVQEGEAEVELQSARAAGMTHWTNRPGGPHRIAVSVDLEGFLRE